MMNTSKKDYFKAKLFVNPKIIPFYEDRLCRKMQLNNFYNIRKPEQRLMQQFKEMFGKQDEVIVGIGDWEQK